MRKRLLFPDIIWDRCHCSGNVKCSFQIENIRKHRLSRKTVLRNGLERWVGFVGENWPLIPLFTNATSQYSRIWRDVMRSQSFGIIVWQVFFFLYFLFEAVMLLKHTCFYSSAKWSKPFLLYYGGQFYRGISKKEGSVTTAHTHPSLANSMFQYHQTSPLGASIKSMQMISQIESQMYLHTESLQWLKGVHSICRSKDSEVQEAQRKAVHLRLRDSYLWTPCSESGGSFYKCVACNRRCRCFKVFSGDELWIYCN